VLYLLTLFLLIRGVAIEERDRFPAATIALTLLLAFLAYCAVFLVMPYNLAGLMESFPRVQLHLWPAAIFFALLITPPVGSASADRLFPGVPRRIDDQSANASQNPA
jgi:hypothetical protein